MTHANIVLCLLLLRPGRVAQPRPSHRTSCSRAPTISRRSRRWSNAPDISGVQIVYSWKSLETAKDQYDFARIEADLALPRERCTGSCSCRCRTGSSRSGIATCPPICSRSRVYGGGLAPQADNPGEDKPEGHGWVAMQWNPAVRERFQTVAAALAQQFDGRVCGVNLPETAVDIDADDDKTGFTCDRYFAAELENIAFARKVFSEITRRAVRELLALRMEQRQRSTCRALFEFAHGERHRRWAARTSFRRGRRR